MDDNRNMAGVAAEGTGILQPQTLTDNEPPSPYRVRIISDTATIFRNFVDWPSAVYGFADTVARPPSGFQSTALMIGDVTQMEFAGELNPDA